MGKKTLILHGTKTSGVLNAVLTDIYHMKKGSAVKFSRKNENIKPFESGGETSLEFFLNRTDCSIFVVSFYFWVILFCWNLLKQGIDQWVFKCLLLSLILFDLECLTCFT
jgi:hypothetical protein